MQVIGTQLINSIMHVPVLFRLSTAALLIVGIQVHTSAQPLSTREIIPTLFDKEFLAQSPMSFSTSMPTPAKEMSPLLEVPSETTLESDDFEETIITDRPDQTEAPQLTPKGWFQFEFGIQSEFDEIKVLNTKTQNTLYNTTLWKYGLTKNVELRLITEYAEEKFTSKNILNEDVTSSTSGFNPVAVGLKIALEKEHGIIPDISLITHLELPYIGADEFKPEFVIPRFRFLFSHTLSDQFSFSYNLGGEWEDGTSAATGIYTVSLGIALIDKLAVFIESYGFAKEKYFPDHRIDGGITYQLTNNFQFDVSGGAGLSDISPDYFLSAGLSLRFKAFN